MRPTRLARVKSAGHSHVTTFAIRGRAARDLLPDETDTAWGFAASELYLVLTFFLDQVVFGLVGLTGGLRLASTWSEMGCVFGSFRPGLLEVSSQQAADLFFLVRVGFSFLILQGLTSVPKCTLYLAF
jgi:hypothetical protein